MSTLLHISDLGKQFGAKVLFEGAEAFIGQRSRVALIGPNGAGKSTLIKIILGLESPDSGTVTRASHLSIGYLAQEVPKLSDRTVLEEVMKLDGRRDELLAARAELEAAFADPDRPDAVAEAQLERYGRVLEELEGLDEYRLESRAKAILTGMGFKPADYTRRLTEFSGGWLMRVALSRILLMEPDLLLLDEPTNHLDLESLLWLEEFLGAYRGALLMISHDTAFLNRLVHEVLEIDQRKLWVYKGNLDAFAVQKEERLTLLRSQHAGQTARIAELEAFVARFGAKATKARQAQSRMKQIERLEAELVDLPENRDRVRFRFPPAPHSGKQVITAKGASFGYGGTPLFRDLNWTLQRGSRMAIVGINGAGKTTLLRLLAQDLAPTAGLLTLGHEVKVGYYAQIQAEALDPRKTILEELEAVAPDWEVARIRAIAGAFLFTGDAVQKRCAVLSGGEKARVALAKLLLKPANFLLLDEPTNHLDVESRGVLLEALESYEGTLCVISHDREFVGPLVTSVLEIVPGAGGSEVHPLLGGYEEYLERKTREIAQAARAQAAAAKPSASAAEAPKAERAGPSNNQKRAWERERDQLEAQIVELEREQSELRVALGDQATYDDPARVSTLVERQRVLSGDLSAKLARWEELALQLEAIGR